VAIDISTIFLPSEVVLAEIMTAKPAPLYAKMQLRQRDKHANITLKEFASKINFNRH